MIDFSKIVNGLGKIGDLLSKGTQFVVKKLSELGIQISPTGSKLINIILLGLALLLAFKILKTAKFFVKWITILCIILLILSTFFSFSI